MKASQFYFPTLRQAPADAEIPSHRLLLRGGFIRPLSAGIFNFLPLGLRVLRRVEEIIRQEMNAAGALELTMPVLQPKELWERTGRWDAFQPTPLRTKDRNDRAFCLAPTHEECITDLVSRDLTSYKQVPLTLYQIQLKFRDEIRPRGGLIRVKEFIMKDAYSFDIDAAGLDKSYDAMYRAYVRIFERLNLPVVIVEAEAGSMGGHDTREFMVLNDSGEDTIFICDQCGYSANAECARIQPPEPAGPRSRSEEPQVVSTPEARTIDAVCAMLNLPAQRLIKTLLYKADDQFVAALVRGDRELNEFKLGNLLGAKELRMATPEEIQEVTGGPVGFSGPQGLPASVRVLADCEVAAMTDAVVGANQADAHLVGVDPGVDFTVEQYTDLREAVHTDPCVKCEGGRLQARRSIELGHVFKLGTKYSAALDAVVDDESGTQRPLIMGCYGIGVSRIVAALVELHHDDDGITWPPAVAPFPVALLLLDPDQPELVALAEQLSGELEAAGLEVLLDDRPERPGVKFKDADLIGYPVRVVVGRRTAESGEVEIRRRRDSEERKVPAAEVLATVQELLAE
ncbi:MAG TPA: proline--tRNA ligase [Armatimonadota bacterium]